MGADEPYPPDSKGQDQSPILKKSAFACADSVCHRVMMEISVVVIIETMKVVIC